MSALYIRNRRATSSGKQCGFSFGCFPNSGEWSLADFFESQFKLLGMYSTVLVASRMAFPSRIRLLGRSPRFFDLCDPIVFPPADTPSLSLCSPNSYPNCVFPDAQRGSPFPVSFICDGFSLIQILSLFYDLASSRSPFHRSPYPPTKDGHGPPFSKPFPRPFTERGGSFSNPVKNFEQSASLLSSPFSPL